MEHNNINIDEVLLTKYLLHEANEEEIRTVEQWIKESDENKSTFESFQKVWKASEQAFIPEVTVDVDEAWHKMNNAILQEDTTKVVQFTPWKRIASAVAAVLIIAIGIKFYRTNQQIEEVSSVEVFKVDIPKLETLNDGSEIMMNANATLAVESFQGNTREVTLEGEAYFEIAHDESKPFIVHTSKGDITVLGTKFNVKTTKEDVVVTVTEGLVKLSSTQKGDTQYVLLEKNTEGAISKNSYAPEKIATKNFNNLFWKTGALNFHNDQFSDVIETLENAYEVKITVENENLNHKQLTVDFHKNSIEEVFEILQATFKIQVQKVGDKTYIIE